MFVINCSLNEGAAMNSDFIAVFNFIREVRHLPEQVREEFLTYKCNYYQFFIRVALVVTCFAEFLFIVSDYALNEEMFRPTLIPRASIFVPMVFYIFAERRAKSRKVRTFLNYFLAECVVLSTIWSVFHLKDKAHFAEGSFSMNLIFIVLGIGSSTAFCVGNYIFFFAEILITNAIIHYENLMVILSLNLPASLAVIFAQIMLSLASYDSFRMTRKLDDMLKTDPMTHIGNRALLDKIVVNNTLKNAENPTSLIMLDVDHFKEVNDEHGHEMGDAVLKYLAGYLNSHVRKGDHVIRYGGDEFLMIMYGSSAADSFHTMERIRHDMEQDEKKPMDFTISDGVAEYRDDFSKALAEADTALYQVKKHGRNSQLIYRTGFGMEPGYVRTDGSQQQNQAGTAASDR